MKTVEQMNWRVGCKQPFVFSFAVKSLYIFFIIIQELLEKYRPGYSTVDGEIDILKSGLNSRIIFNVCAFHVVLGIITRNPLPHPYSSFRNGTISMLFLWKRNSYGLTEYTYVGLLTFLYICVCEKLTSAVEDICTAGEIRESR